MTVGERTAMSDDDQTTWREEAGRDLTFNAGERLELFVRGEGAYLWDADGRRYLDFLAGIAVNSL